MTDNDLKFLQEMKRAAQKATPGPWAYEAVDEKGNGWCLGVVVDVDDNPLSGRLEGDEGDVDEEVCRGDGLNNAEFIASASPDRVLRLVSLAEKAMGA